MLVSSGRDVCWVRQSCARAGAAARTTGRSQDPATPLGLANAGTVAFTVASLARPARVALHAGGLGLPWSSRPDLLEDAFVCGQRLVRLLRRTIAVRERLRRLDLCLDQHPL